MKFSIWPRLVLNPVYFCLWLQTAGITGMHRHAWLLTAINIQKLSADFLSVFTNVRCILFRSKLIRYQGQSEM